MINSVTIRAKALFQFLYQSFGFFTRIYAFSFLIGSTLYMWYLFMRAVRNGGWICFTTNQVNEQNPELMMAALGFSCVIIYLPWLFRKFVMRKQKQKQ